MLKGIILELRKKYAIIITKEGNFKKIQTQPTFTHVGQEVEISEKKQVTFANHLQYTASFLIFILLATFYFLNPSQVYAYVTIGKKPSLELAIDRHQKVLSISALTDDAKSIIKDLDYKNHTVIEVVQSIAMVTMQKKYIKENSNQKFVITTISRNPNNLEIQKLNTSITAAANDVIQNKAQIISQNTTFKKHKRALKKQASAEKIQPKSSSTISQPHRINVNESQQKNPISRGNKRKKRLNHSKK